MPDHEPFISPEQLSAFMERAAEQAEAERAQEIESIQEMGPEDISDHLSAALDNTDVVISGLRLTSAGLSEGMSIAYAAMMRLRDAIDDVLVWIETNHPEAGDKDSNLESTIKTLRHQDDDAEM